MKKQVKHVISVSGGKDSTALLLLAIERLGRDKITPIFCDTGNEHEAVYRYLDYLDATLGIKIVRLKADFTQEMQAKRRFIARDQRTGRDKNGRKTRWTNKAKRRALEVLKPTGNPYLDLCLLKGRFPSAKAAFCSHELKRNVAVAFQLDLIDAGFNVVAWQGIRRDESPKRSTAKKAEKLGPSMRAFRPLVDWTAAQCFEMHKKHGIDPNPLYLMGMGRVGCMPCINVKKDELREISSRFPQHIERVDEWESLVSRASKHGFSTFLHKLPQKTHQPPAVIFEIANIKSHVEWSKTTRGGVQFDLLSPVGGGDVCASAYGLCE